MVGEGKIEEEERRTGESRSSVRLRPAGKEKKEGERGGGEKGREEGGADLNLAAPDAGSWPIPSRRGSS